MRSLKSNEIQAISGGSDPDAICVVPAVALAVMISPAVLVSSPIPVIQALMNGESVLSSIGQGFSHLGNIKGAYDHARD